MAATKRCMSPVYLVISSTSVFAIIQRSCGNLIGTSLPQTRRTHCLIFIKQLATSIWTLLDGKNTHTCSSRIAI